MQQAGSMSEGRSGLPPRLVAATAPIPRGRPPAGKLDLGYDAVVKGAFLLAGVAERYESLPAKRRQYIRNLRQRFNRNGVDVPEDVKNRELSEALKLVERQPSAKQASPAPKRALAAAAPATATRKKAAKEKCAAPVAKRAGKSQKAVGLCP